MNKLSLVLLLFVLNKVVYSTHSPKNKFNSSPVNFNVVGDTSHLFAPEDFEKIEVQPLHYLKTNDAELPKKETTQNSTCQPKNLENFENSVKIVNGSGLTKTLYESQQNECFVVLFYVPWCPFSAKLAPYFNALPRAIPHLDFLAFDVSKSIG